MPKLTFGTISEIIDDTAKIYRVAFVDLSRGESTQRNEIVYHGQFDSLVVGEAVFVANTNFKIFTVFRLSVISNLIGKLETENNLKPEMRRVFT